MKHLIVFLCSCLLHFGLYSQPDCKYTISGKVISEEHKEILCFSELFIPELQQSVAADLDGSYIFPKVCPGEYTLICRHLGYVTETVKITVANKNVHHGFYLKSSVTHLEEAHVEGHLDVKMNVQSETVLDEHDLDRSRGLTLGESLKRIPGVTTLNTGTAISKPMIHGLTGRRLLIMNNGVRQEGQQWGSEHGPEIDPFVAKRITVVKGANGVRYGSDAMGGVVLVDPAPLAAPTGVRGELNWVGQLNGYSNAVSGMLEGSFRKWAPFTWRVQGTYKRGGDQRAPGYFLSNSGVEEYNFSAGLGYMKAKWGWEVSYSMFNTKIAILEASHFGNLGDLDNAIKSPVPLIIRDFSFSIRNPYQFLRHQLVKGSAYVRTGEKGKLEFTLAYQDNNRREYDKHKPFNDSLASLNKPALQFILQTVTADVAWNHSIGSKVSGVVGISSLYQTNRWYGAYLIPSFRNVNNGIYWIERWKVSPVVELEAGVRFDYNYLQVYKYEGNVLTKPDYHFYNVAANAGAVFHAHQNLHIRFNYGSSWRPPHVSELYSDGVHHGSATFEVGDQNLQPERAHNFNLMLNYSGKWFRGEVSAYYYFIQDFIYLQPVQPPTLTIRGAFPTFRYQQANVDLKGIDADVDINITKRLVLNGKMMILWAWNYTQDDWLVLMPPGRYEAGLTYNFKDLKKIKNTFLSFQMTYVDKQWRSPKEGDYMPPPDAYILFGLEGGTSFKIGSQQLDVSVQVTNLFDAAYRDYLNRFRYFSDEVGRNVLVRIKWPFTIKN